MENGKLALEAAGLSIPYPQQDVYMHQQPAA
jgi:small-conductance mechanosensitive channel